MAAPDISGLLRSVPNFPKQGITFYDISPLLQDAKAYKRVVDYFTMRATTIDIVAGIESRGFLFAAPVALALGKPFIPIRKAGKLPRASYTAEYELEYGSARLQMHRDALMPGAKVLLVDDVLASGGTSRAATQLIAQAGANCVQTQFLLELTLLGGRKRLKDIPVSALCQI